MPPGHRNHPGVHIRLGEIYRLSCFRIGCNGDKFHGVFQHGRIIQGILLSVKAAKKTGRPGYGTVRWSDLKSGLEDQFFGFQSL